jgi:hypothetical protein
VLALLALNEDDIEAVEGGEAAKRVSIVPE